MSKILVIAPNSIHTKKFIDLINQNNEVTLLCLEDSDRYEYNSKVEFIPNTFFSILAIKKKLAEYKPDIIHIHTINKVCFLSCILIKAFFKIPVIITSWGSDVLVIPNKSFVHKSIVKYCLNNASCVTYDSFIQKYEMKKLCAKDKYVEASFGLPNSFFQNDSEKEKIIYSSRAHLENSNLDIVIEKFSIFAKDNPEYKLMISGRQNPTITPKLKASVQSLSIENNVEFLDFLDADSNTEIMKKAMAYVSIPTSDAKSASVMEAIAAQCIIFASDIPANYDMVVDGINGFLSSPNELDFNDLNKINNTLLRPLNGALKAKYSNEYNSKVFNNIYIKLTNIT